MDSDINLRAVEIESLTNLDVLLAGLSGNVPLLVVRIPDLERTAWRRGLRSARALERRAMQAFGVAARRVLRGEDRIGHDPGSDIFVAALVAPPRARVDLPAALDARSALARIAATLEHTTRLDVLTGWTTFVPGGAHIGASIDDALARGARERERYAFFSALGHELRTPLASIRGYLETLLDDSIDASTRRRFLTVAHNESLRMSRLVDGMFEISLLDLHATFPNRSIASLDLALCAANDAVGAAAAARSVILVVPRVAPISVAMDGDRLTLVLINLIDNAIKHGRLAGTVRVSVGLSEGRSARITVDDDGPGVAPAEREAIFALGERGSTLAHGSGIGLALVRLMLERVGGSVDVSESPTGGARFVIRVPRREAVA
jgi:signal transduction histidine kinase